MAKKGKKEEKSVPLFCNNCGKEADRKESLLCRHQGNIVFIVCPKCITAKKLNITVARNNKEEPWTYYQLMPVEYFK